MSCVACRRTFASVVVVAAAGGLLSWRAHAQQTPPATQSLAVGARTDGVTDAEKGKPAGWTLEQARQHLRLYPHDAYVQYVALRLAQREGRSDEIAREIERRAGLTDRRSGRRQDVDVFSLFSGALAVQESLQLDAMLGDDPNGQTPAAMARGRVGPQPLANDRQARRDSTVPLGEVEGPTIKSHPWQDMLAGRSPKVSRLSQCVPDDFYFVEFCSLNKLLEAAQLSDLWGRRVFNQSLLEAETQLVNERLQRQLAVEDSPLLRPFYDAFIAGVAVTGSDLFLREGSDVTLLFQLQQEAGFRRQMDEMLARALQSRQDAQRTVESYHGVEVVHVATPDRQIHVFSASPAPDLHVRSNSRSGLRRVLDAVRGETPAGNPVTRLGDTQEFQYIRALMPLGDGDEDGFIYLSDPFIRRLVGPQLRINESRRLRCYNHLKMIGHAALMYRTEQRASAEGLAQLTAAGCAPGEFGAGKLACPDGGTYALADDGLTGVCSHHGYASYLTPCCENELASITDQERRAYEQFLAAYNQYWRTFFDPIAVKLTLTPERYRAETIVLPLIDNTIYSSLAAALGGQPEPLDALPVPDRNIFSLAVRLDKEQLLRMAGLESLLDESEESGLALQQGRDASQAVMSLRQLALALLNYESAHKRFPPAAKLDVDGKPLLSWRVHVLPFLEAGQLYEEFHLDEPWDSPHNRQLIARMPAVFRSDNEALNQAGKTRFVAAVGADTAFPANHQGVGFRQITDGLSQTIALLEVRDADAVIWTKPDDVTADEDLPEKLAVRPGNAFLAAFCDGSVRHISREIDQPMLAALSTKSGGEVVNWRTFDRTPPSRVGPFRNFDQQVAHELQLGRFLSGGIGNQVAFHVYDAEPLVGFNLSQVVGMAVGSVRGGRFGDEVLWLGMLVGAVNSPVYASVPVKDRQVVDDFLERLDNVLNETARDDRGGGFFSLEQDFYRLSTASGSSIRSYCLRIGPVTWRFFWQRIGDGLYVASKPEVLQDIAALAAEDQVASGDGPAAHAMVRLRPQHWDRVLSEFRLGWAENNRQACLKNCGPLYSLARAVREPPHSTNVAKLQDYAARLYDVHYFCPDGGEYTVAPDNEIACSVHGSAHAPRQAASPASDSRLGRLMQEFSGLTLSLVFLEDGLHAVVEIGRGSGDE